MSIESENTSTIAAEAPATKGPRKAKAKPAKKARGAKKPASKPKAERTTKKADVIAMMKRANGSLADRKHRG
jgi:hypothetical protein